MRILIRVRSRAGGDTPPGRVIDTGTLRIGSGQDQDLHIAEPRIGLAHVELSSNARGRFSLVDAEASKGEGKGRPRKNLRFGQSIDCGRFRLHLLKPPEGFDLLLEQEELRSPRDDRQQRIGRFKASIGQPISGRRGWSWLLFVGVLATGLALPIWLRYGVTQPVRQQILPPSLDQPVSAAPEGMMALWVSDRAWSPGPTSPVHAHFQNDCGQCHDKPFEPVRNDACLACHEKTPQHVDDPKLLALPMFGAARCENCHLEHQGSAGMAARQDARCSVCHADPHTRFPDTKLEPAEDFANRHPVFTPKLARYDKDRREFGWIDAPPDLSTLEPVRFLPPPGELRSDTNLRYSHERHLDPAGIKSPTGLKVLKCDACHVPDGSGVGFRPISMPAHCAECHRLDFDPDDPFRAVPHGSETAVVDTIRDYYGRIALGGGISAPGAPAVVQLRRKPGETLTSEAAMAALSWADQRSKLVIDEVFDERICTYCHTVERAGPTTSPAKAPAVVHNGNSLGLAPMTQSPWQIAPVQLATHRLTRSKAFPHSQHVTEKCTSCHAAPESKHSEEVLMPPISRCRDCHGGRGSNARIESVCTDCHGFHLADHALMMEGEQKRKSPFGRLRLSTP